MEQSEDSIVLNVQCKYFLLFYRRMQHIIKRNTIYYFQMHARTAFYSVHAKDMCLLKP